VTEDREKHFLDAARRVLDQAERDLDGATRARLRAARARALNEGRRPWTRPGAWWLPLGGFAAAAVVVLAVALWFAAPSGAPPGIEDLELLTALDNQELYDEPEFYRWLAGTADAS